MTATNGHNGHTHSTSDGTGSGPMAGSRPLVLLRARRGMVAESARVVHLAPLPVGGTGAVSAICGALLRPEEHEPVQPGFGMPCSMCMISDTRPPDPDPASPATADPPPASPDPTSPDTPPRAAAHGYRGWGWPVTVRRNQVWLVLDRDAVAVLLPTVLGVEVTALLARRRRLPAVLAHPYAPEHVVLLCGEPFGTALGWPPDVHRIRDRAAATHRHPARAAELGAPTRTGRPPGLSGDRHRGRRAGAARPTARVGADALLTGSAGELGPGHPHLDGIRWPGWEPRGGPDTGGYRVVPLRCPGLRDPRRASGQT
ncbi:MAG TPA: hypothetical protein VGJ13_02560 [Pseudonocardiaceae bacterium]